MSHTNTRRYNNNMTTRTDNNLTSRTDNKLNMLNYEQSLPSRTLLVRNSDTKLPVLKGLLEDKAYTKTGNAFFLTFDTLPNAITAYNSLTTLAFNAKYSYYRVFFTLSYTDNSQFPNDKFNHEQLKTELTDLVSKHGSILFYKQYKKENKFLNCGYFTVDKIDTLNTLLSKESGLKDFTLSNNVKGTFYKFNNKNYQTNNFTSNTANA
jgi:hypothetical protein